MRRLAKWLGWLLAFLVGIPVLLVIVVLIAANTGAGRNLIERLTPRLTGNTVRLTGLAGRFPDALRVRRIELLDTEGDYATIDDAVLDWSPSQLLHGRILIDRLAAEKIDAMRMPVGPSSSGGSSVPPLPVELRQLAVSHLEIGAALAGTAMTLGVEGSGAVSSADQFRIALDVRQLGGSGHYVLNGDSNASGLHVTLQGSEPSHGLLSGMAGLPELGPVVLNATVNGPRDAMATRVALTAGPLRADASGTVDLDHSKADVTLSATAPAMQPRPDVAWQSVTLEAHVTGPFTRPDASGHLGIDRISAFGAGVDSIAASITGNAGEIHLSAEANGVHVPGPNPDLMAGGPLLVQADARLDQPDRPVRIKVRQKLLDADAVARLGATRSLDAAIRLADLSPFAAIGHVDLQGGLALHVQAAMQGQTTTVGMTGTVGITGGQQQAQALIGKDGRFQMAATVKGSDITLSQLSLRGQAMTLSANGSLAENKVAGHWTLGVNDLAAADASLNGQLEAKGDVSGETDDMSLIADINGGVAARGMSSGALAAHIDVQGLPTNPSARIDAHGSLLDAPIDLVVALQKRNDGLSIDIQQASWKSMQAGGAVQVPTATMVPAGNLRLAIGRLADFAPLVGQRLSGAASATLDATPDKVHLTAEVQNAELGAVAGASRIGLVADVNQPQSRPVLDARLDATGIRAKGESGSLQATASGPADAIAVKLAATSLDLSGAPARLNAAATVDTTKRTVTLASLQADWHQQTARLLAPATFDLRNGVAIDHLRLGMRQSILAVSGRIGSTLDVTASLHDLPADIAAAVAPAYAANGMVNADARITGTTSRPTGKVHLAATGLRLRSGPGRAVPAANLTADATLNGTDARIEVRANAGKSRFNLTGRAPLAANGALDLRTNGALDLAMLEPVLAANGRYVRGEITLNATIAGSVRSPNVTGSAQLTGGEVQDYTTGLHLTDVAVAVQGNGASIRLSRFSARAGDGTISGSGTVGVREPGMPVDLTLQADKAKLLASDLMTAIIDARLSIRGQALSQLALDGTIRIERADIRVPERMPSSIAVLPVREAGTKPPPPPAPPLQIALNLTVDAPRQIFIRGRGLDSEFGGMIKVSGLASAPRTQGGFNLIRGTLNVAGHTLDFSEGKIGFNGGSVSDPTIHLVATSSNSTVTATLSIDGTARNLKITLSSTPPLPQDEVLAQLLFGSGTGKLGALEVAELAAGLATLTGTGGVGDPLDKVRQGLGLDRLSVGSNSNGNPTLEAGRYIAPGVYLGAQQSASGGGTQASVQVDIAKGLKLQGTAGTGTDSATGANGASSGTSVGLTYQFQY